MGRFDEVKATINAKIKTNGKQEITGNVLNQVLNGMVSATETQVVELSNEIQGISPAPMVSVTHAQLVSLRDNGQLVAGSYYRIIDYIATTSQENTKSDGHPFNVIVLALGENILAAKAWAIQHEGDEHFANDNLSAWELWYCLDNDTERYAWADAENGKGVIYRLIDELGNDFPYDFKNIQVYVYNAETTLSEWRSAIYGRSKFNVVHSRRDADGKYLIPMVTINGGSDNEVGYNCNNCVINTYNNCSIGAESKSIYFNADGCVVGEKCNTIRLNCNNTTVGNECEYIRIGLARDAGNIISSKCKNITIGDGSYGNVFGDGCENIIMGNYTRYNTFGAHTLGVAGQNNCFGNNFAPNCQDIELDYNCQYNTFGENCRYIKIGIKHTTRFYRQNSFAPGTYKCNLDCAETGGSSNYVQNYNISGRNIGDVAAQRNLEYQTTIAKDSGGKIQKFCMADLV